MDMKLIEKFLVEECGYKSIEDAKGKYVSFRAWVSFSCPRLPLSSSSISKPDAVPSSATAGKLNGKTTALLILLSAIIAR